jgi:hypothetical protein
MIITGFLNGESSGVSCRVPGMKRGVSLSFFVYLRDSGPDSANISEKQKTEILNKLKCMKTTPPGSASFDRLPVV